VFAVPVGLTGLITLAGGWLYAQRYIAITAKGVQRQDLFTYESIHWDRIIDLRVEKASERPSDHDVHVVRGSEKTVRFRPGEVHDGEKLVIFLEARSGLRWSRD
jgi:hypothetical protein